MIKPDTETEPAMDLAHPLGVTAREVVVDRDEMDAVAGEAVEIGGQGRHQGLALARLHLRDPAEVECRTAHELHVVVALADRSTRCLAAHGEGLEEQVVEIGAVVETLTELGGLGLECVVGQRTDLGFEGVDVGDHALQRLDLLAFTGAEDAIENSHAASQPTGATRADGSGHERRATRGDPLALSRRGCTGRRGGDRVQTWFDDACVAQRGRRSAERCSGGDDVVDDDHPSAVETGASDELGTVEPFDAAPTGLRRCRAGSYEQSATRDPELARDVAGRPVHPDRSPAPGVVRRSSAPR
jgi:hypothetical protein